MMRKPRVFIGSSTEGLNVAYKIQKALDYSCESTVWTQGVFKLTRSSLSSLVHAMNEHEYAVFVLTPDDILNLRKQEFVVARDNVLFELGLFIGRYGPEQVFMVQPRGCDQFHIPSDLLGIAPATYNPSRSDGNLAAALGPACSDIQASILEHSRPKFSPTLLAEFRDLERRFAAALRVRIGRLEIPEGLPMPDTLEDLAPKRLFQILSLADDKAAIGSPFTRYMACRLRAEKKSGEPADPLDEYDFESILGDFRDGLESWEAG